MICQVVYCGTVVLIAWYHIKVTADHSGISHDFEGEVLLSPCFALGGRLDQIL